MANNHQAFHTQTLEEIINYFQTDINRGLTSAEAEKRLKIYGANEIQENRIRTNLEIFLDQFKDLMLLMLIGVAIISGILDLIDLSTANSVEQDIIPFKDTIAILSIVIINGILGYIQESRAEKSLAALKKMSAPQVQCIRDGQRQIIKAEKIVPGDIIFLEAGSQVCADGRIIEAVNLQVRESALTGEANSIVKSAHVSGLREDTPLGDRLNMVFAGTEVIQGRGKVLVTNTGMTTELGKIAAMLQEVEVEETPLQRRMNQLGKVLVTGALTLVAIVITIGLIETGDLSKLETLVETSLSMAVAVVPEGLPAVITVTLAIGTQRMIKRNALIRRLPAVETLGSVNTICSDKTGTLTQNKMVVQEVATVTNVYQITGKGYEPLGDFLNDKFEPIAPQNIPELRILLVGAVLCNDAILKKETNEWSILGDPTEGALLALAGKAGLQQQTLNTLYQRVGEIPFSSERKCMSVICQSSSPNFLGDIPSTPYVMFTKGSVESVLEKCQFYQKDQEIFRLKAEINQNILKTNDSMAKKGLRVLGFAYKPLIQIPQLENTVEQELIWLGLVGMVDPPRPEAKESVKKCQAAGIRVIMITGDHQLTAQTIAQQLGIAQPGDKSLTGQQLSKLTQTELEVQVEKVSIYARVSPEQKLGIVKALKKRGRFVAMTGDGVNDAPALKQADIGIAMGITGTDVSKEASDMILLDDNFATIVAAVEEGRVVYSNIRRFIKYILGSNLGEVITIGTAPLLGLPDVPLTPLQILWMNLVTDGLPALALAVEPAEPNIMQRPPFNTNESIFARGLGYYIVRVGTIFAFITISLMLWAFGVRGTSGNPNSWKTMVFTTLCLAQMGHALAVRSDTRLTLQLNLFSNPYLLLAVTTTTVLQLMLIYVAPLRQFFGNYLLSFQQLLICLGFSTLIFVWVELEKLLIAWLSRSRQNRRKL